MKTSNKLLTLLTLIIISALVLYNFGLRAEYKKGEYKSRFYRMTEMKLGGFTAIENNASNLYVRIEQGDKFQIWYSKEIDKKIELKKIGNLLVVDFKKDNNEDDYYRSEQVIVICPRVENVTVNSLNGKNNTKNKHPKDSYIPHGETTLFGFKQENFTINLKPNTEVNLEKVVFNNLKATVEGSKAEKGILNFNSDNQINNLNVEVKGFSVLNLKSPTINKAQFQLSDSAEVNLSGKVLKLINIIN